jgi:hypothetical protein
MISAHLSAARPDLLEMTVVEGDSIRRLRYEGWGEVWPAQPSRLDFAAVALAQYAAASGQDLHLNGPVTRDLLVNLDEYLRIWAVWRPDRFAHVELTADAEVPAAPGPRGAVIGFSGGVDSSFALAAHASGLLGRQSRSVDRGVLVIGWDIRHGDLAAARRVERSAAESLRAYGADLAVVSTNFQQEFCPAWFMMFNAGLVSVLTTFADDYSGAVVGNDQTYLQEFRTGPYGCHSSVNHLLGQPAFPVVTAGGTHDRVERLRVLRDHPALLKGLRVCFQSWAGGRNCGHCGKCLRTNLEMRAAGLDPSVAFPEPFTAEDFLRDAPANPLVYWRHHDLYDQLPDDDPWRAHVGQWLDRHGTRPARPGAALRARVADLEQRLVAADAVVDELHASTSWRVTAPLRAVGSIGRRLTDQR